VCAEARCPNVGECWGAGTATFMILGDLCTRGCRFCAVLRGNQGGSVDLEEPERVKEAVVRMGLEYAVITSVTRDDLDDGGASVFATAIRAVKSLNPPVSVEVLTPDYIGGDLEIVLKAGPDVFAHNIEVVKRLTPSMRHAKFSYERSLECLSQARAFDSHLKTKSSIMLGLGESDVEVEDAMADLLDVGVEILVLGQYLQPTRDHAEVVEYVHPGRFEEWALLGRSMGFGYVAAGPLVRTSYRAAEAYVRGSKDAG
jgi:lipoic acid synthetase